MQLTLAQESLSLECGDLLWQLSFASEARPLVIVCTRLRGGPAGDVGGSLDSLKCNLMRGGGRQTLRCGRRRCHTQQCCCSPTPTMRFWSQCSSINDGCEPKWAPTLLDRFIRGLSRNLHKMPRAAAARRGHDSSTRIDQMLNDRCSCVVKHKATNQQHAFCKPHPQIA